MASFQDLTTAQLKHAVQIREQIESLQAKLDALLGGREPKAKPDRTTAKRNITAATRKKMAVAQQARRAKTTGKPAKAPVLMVAKKKGGLTAAGRAKLSAAMKARWAARKKGAPAPNASAV